MKIGSTEISNIKIGSTAINKVIRNGVFYFRSGISVPSNPDILFWLDGTILDVSGTKYFQDKSPNARNFLITNYDFSSDWTTGMPYKSAATISAPVGDAALIAADINNYLYDTGGTPNQIPVVSLFQDIDYGHRLFSRHAAQVLDGNDVETYEARVLEVVFYSAAKTGANLTLCNTYFGVPTEDATAKWVDFVNGNDTNGDGSKALPYKSIVKIQTLTLPVNSTVYFKTGLFDNGATAINLTKEIRYTAIGNTGLKTTYPLVLRAISTGLSIYVEGFKLIYGSYAAGGGVSIENAFAHIFVRCYIGPVRQGASITSSGSATFRHCVFDNASLTIGKEGSNVHTIILDSCYQKYYSGLFVNASSTNVQAASVYKYLNCKLNNSSYINSGVWTVLGNKFSNIAFVAITGADHTGSVAFSYNTLTPTTGNLTLIGNVSSIGTNDIIFSWNIHHNSFIDNYSDVTCINLVEQPSVNIHDNIFYHTGAASSTARVSITGTLLTTTTCNVSNNTISSDSYCGTIILGGEATNRANKITNPICNNNLISMANHTNSIHGIAIFRQSNPTVKYNKLIGTGLGVVVKCLESESSGGIVAYNVLVESKGPLLGKGSNGVLWYNNTCYNSEGIYGAFCMIVCEYTGSTGALNNVFKNNTVYDSSVVDGDGGHNNILITDQSAGQLAANGNVLTNNCVHTVYGKYSSAYATLALAQAAGLEAGSVGTNPNLTAGLWPSSPILIGEDLGATYDNGLDVTTNWGSSSAIPVIVNRTQSAAGAWQVGAYVQ